MCLASALLGAAVTYALLPSPGEKSAIASRRIAEPAAQAGLASRAVPLDVESPPFVAERVVAYRAAAQIGSASALESEIKRVLALSGSARDHTTLEALLLRFIEVAPERAIQYARDTFIERALVVEMFRAWVSVDPDAALAMLQDSEDRFFVRSIALELVDLIGRSVSEIQELGELMDPMDRDGFLSDALAHLAESDPAVAFDGAMGMRDGALQERTIRRIAAAWAHQDAPAALAMNRARDDVEPSLRHLFSALVIREWATIDPDRALEHWLSVDGRQLFDLNWNGPALAIPILAMRRPDALLAAANSMPEGAISTTLRRAAIQVLVEQDIESAMARFTAMAPGIRKNEWLATIAMSLTQQDSAMALQWAREISSTSAGAMAEVIQQISRNDRAFAIDLALQSQSTAGLVERMLSSVDSLDEMSPEQVESIANRLLATGTAQHEALQNLVSNWPLTDPEAALAWLLAQGQDLDASYVTALAEGFLRDDVALAARTVTELPLSMRADWFIAVAGKYVHADPQTGLEWLVQFNREPDYGDWVTAAIDRMTSPLAQIMGDRVDPIVLAAMLDTVPEPSAEAARNVAGLYAGRDPRGAVRWALELPNAEARAVGVAQAVAEWTVDEPAAAERWVLSLPRGAVRDRALGAVLAQNISSRGVIESRVINAFSTDEARRRALQRSFYGFRSLGSRQPDLALDLVDRYVEDSELRRRIKEDIARIRDRNFSADPALTISVLVD